MLFNMFPYSAFFVCIICLVNILACTYDDDITKVCNETVIEQKNQTKKLCCSLLDIQKELKSGATHALLKENGICQVCAGGSERNEKEGIILIEDNE